MSGRDDSGGASDRHEAEYEIRNELGLHVRAAAILVRTAGRYRSEVVLAIGDREADARSVLDLLTLAASKGTRVVVRAVGPDARDAVDGVGGCIARKFAESDDV